MQEKERAKLEAIIALGKWPFVVKQGIVSWGISTALLYSLISHFLSHQPFLKTLYTAAPVFSLAGALWGLFMWHFFNRRWNRVLADMLHDSSSQK